MLSPGTDKGRNEIFFFDFGFTALIRIFHLYQADRSSKVGENPEKPGKTTENTKQNLAFSHVT